METAALIGRPHGLTPLPCPSLQEVNVGHWEGQSWPAIARAEPEAYRLFQQDPAAHGYAGGENLEQVCRRALPAALEIMRRHVGSVVLVAGHNVVNRVLLASWMNIPLAKARSIEQDNCGLNVIRFRQDHVHVLTLNTAFHLY
jgi:broad specificity phosphatase PhoE